MKRKGPIIVTISFLMVLFIAFSSSVILPDKDFSNSENRPLEQFPTLSLSGLISGETQEKLNRYVSDQFPLREQLVALKSLCEYALFKRDIGGVYILSDGSYAEKVEPNESLYNANLSAIDQFADLNKNTPCYFLPVPTAAHTNRELLPKFALTSDSDKMLKKAEALAHLTTINVAPTFDLLKKEKSLFYKTDHHWTSHASYAAYLEFLKQSGTNKSHELSCSTLCDDFLGTLHSKVLLPFKKPDSIEVYNTPYDKNLKLEVEGEIKPVYDKEKLTAKDKYAYFLGGNYPRAELSGGTNNGKKLLLIKDSYANCFAPMLACNYEKIILLDPRYFVGSVSEIIKEEKIDTILFLYSLDSLSTDNSVQLILE